MLKRNRARCPGEKLLRQDFPLQGRCPPRIDLRVSGFFCIYPDAGAEHQDAGLGFGSIPAPTAEYCLYLAAFCRLC